MADGINAAISLCRGNYLEALICVVAMLPFGDMLKSLKYADEAKGILKYGDEFLKGVKTVAKEGSEKLSKQMSKVIKSGKLDNVIASMDAGKHYIVKMRDGTVTAIEKTGLPEKIRVCLGNGCFIAGTLVTTRSGLKHIEEIQIGDYVLSRNEEIGEDSYKKVTDTLVRSTQEICTIELENGNIKSTTEHLFMVKDKWWKSAVELLVGDVLVTVEGKEQVVKSIKVEEKGYPVITYNLTVEDNHTFFVSDEGVLTHNMNNVLKGCNFAKEGIEEVSESATKRTTKADFTGKLRGESVTLKDVKTKEISYIKRDSYELNTLRNDFNTSVRKSFLEDLSKNVEYLKEAGFTEKDILKMQNGRVPDGWQVHHKLPLDDSGTNSFDNLVLIKNEPYHKVITNYQNSFVKQLEVGEIKSVNWPIPERNIYPQKH